MSSMNTITKVSTNSSPTKTSSSQQVEQADVDDFARSMQKEEKDSKPKEDSLPQKKTPGDAILGGLIQQKNTDMIAKNSEVKGVNTKPISDDVLQKLVDSILVSSKDTVQEVRIRVNQALLPETNIVLRMEEGKLFVQLATANAQSALTLHQNVQELENRLRNSCKDREINVKVVEKTDSSQNAQEQGDTGQQQSRGHFLWEQSGGK